MIANFDSNLSRYSQLTTRPQACTSRQSQQGVVLFIAMIALVVMSLAAVALIRSVDTNTLITGNLSFKQTSIASSSYGIESLSDYLGAQALNYGSNNDANNGYYAVCTSTQSSADNPCDGANITAAATWQAGATSRLADGLGIVDGVDAYGNTIEYIVERMCYEQIDVIANPALARQRCLLAKRTNDNRSKNVLNMTRVGAPEVLTDLPVYRVTVRVTGPKNTVSFIQAFIS